MLFLKDNLYWLTGDVFHQRFQPNKNKFTYPYFGVLIRLTEKSYEWSAVSALKKASYSLFSINAKSYLSKDFTSINENLFSFLRKKLGIEPQKNEEIYLATIPKMFGYVFNPVSFYFFIEDSNVKRVLVEVNNTFGERHVYWISSKEFVENKWIRKKKEFFVSPFYKENGYYEFKFITNNDRLNIFINYFPNPPSREVFNTRLSVIAKKKQKNDFFPFISKFGWFSIKAIYWIHLQAFKLLLKKVPYVTRVKRKKLNITT